MSNTTSLSDAEATPAARLIVKAVMGWQFGSTYGTQRWAEYRLGVFGEVAADVLDIAQTPAGFVMVIREASNDHPYPSASGARRERAVTMREAWQREVVADVLDRLSTNDGRPSNRARD